VTSRTRLFVALELPDPIRDALARWAVARVGGRAKLRMVPAGSLHVTLCFLGWRDETEVDALGSLVMACAAPVTGLSLGPPVWLPRRRPGVLAIELVDVTSALAALQGRVAQKLADEAGYEPESRPYRPHVTVARVRSGARLTRADRELPDGPASPPFDGAALTLYRSRLRREGALYEPAARAELGRAAGGAPAGAC
jgi:2'-5' RNA ligase